MKKRSSFWQKLKSKFSRKKKEETSAELDAQESDIFASEDTDISEELFSVSDSDQNEIPTEVNEQIAQAAQGFDKTEEIQIPQNFPEDDFTGPTQNELEPLADNTEEVHGAEESIEPTQEFTEEVAAKPSLKEKLLNSTKNLGSKLKKQTKVQAIPKAKPLKENTLKKLLDFQNAGQELFSPKLRDKIHQFFISSIIIAGTYSTGKSIATLVKGDKVISNPENMSVEIAPSPDYQKIAKQIAKTNLFQAKKEKAQVVDKPVEKIDTPCEIAEAKKKSAERIKLVSTIVLQDSIKSIAAVQLRGSNKITHLREGDQIKGVGKLDKIDRLKIVFRNPQTQNCEYVANDKFKGPNKQIRVLSPKEGNELIAQEKPKGIKNDGNNYQICRSYMNKQMADISNVIQQAKGTPFPSGDGYTYFKISDVEPGGVFSHLGIQDGDVITRINGNKIKDVSEVMVLFNKLTTATNLQLSFKRGDEEVNFDYTFDGAPTCEGKG